ncbi:hypothetical protein L211DRAFT_844610 [Terfezia boudieri ATCC MYA-4762]|uniref:Uncharacterized protein n=1 Tax=Terfezia boudieri ATCC MYA-4762 TaxID=1051890 RepID=A0A3N4M811_9PEZI|nr:hypothetical protein L211DRAFT_844610 [Terfezia boudieri ATCC MYA-4762]
MSSDSDLPHKSGGLASFPTWAYKYGQYSITHLPIVQDSQGRIVQNIPGRPSRGGDIIVDLDRNPSRNGIALIGWNEDMQGAPLERCFSANGGPGAVWYDGSLQGQFIAAPYSSIAANSQSGSKTRVYFQDEKNQIRELYKEGVDTFDPFVLVENNRPAALKGTRIATDSNVNGASEVYYQSPTLDWVLDGAGIQANFKLADEFPYTPGAPIAVAGSVSQGGARVFTVNKEGRLVVTAYDKSNLSWKPSAELVKVQPTRQIWVSNHPQPYHGQLFRHPTTAFVSQSNNHTVITRVGFTDTTFEGWDVLPHDF